MYKIYRVEKRTQTTIDGPFHYQNPCLIQLQNLEARVELGLQDRLPIYGFSYAIWRHPRVTLSQDPYLREAWLKLLASGDYKCWMTGCRDLDGLRTWFPEHVRELLDNEGYKVTKYYFKNAIHGLRQSIGLRDENSKHYVMGGVREVLLL